MKWESYSLKEVANYWTGKVAANVLSSSTYISTENLISDKGGVVESSYVPKSGKVCSYSLNDVLVSNIRPYFKKIWFAVADGGCSNDVLVFRAKVNVDPKYLYYQLSKDAFFDYMMAGSNGTKMPRGNKTSIMEYGLQLPPLPIQHRIASILSDYDDLIENNLHRIKLLEDAARCEYRLLLEDGTQEVEFRDLVKWVKGKKPKDISQALLDGYLPYLVFDTIEGNAVTFAHTEKVPIASTYDVLMCMDGARSGVVFRGMDGVLGSTFATLKLEQPAHSEYVYQFLSTNLEYIVQGNVGAAIPHANREYINSMKISMPDQVSLDDYNCKVGPLVSLISNLKAQNTQLRQARDILLPKLMSGEIEVEGDDNSGTILELTTVETVAAEDQTPNSKPRKGTPLTQLDSQ